MLVRLLEVMKDPREAHTNGPHLPLVVGAVADGGDDLGFVILVDDDGARAGRSGVGLGSSVREDGGGAGRYGADEAVAALQGEGRLLSRALSGCSSGAKGGLPLESSWRSPRRLPNFEPLVGGESGDVPRGEALSRRRLQQGVLVAPPNPRRPLK